MIFHIVTKPLNISKINIQMCVSKLRRVKPGLLFTGLFFKQFNSKCEDISKT